MKTFIFYLFGYLLWLQVADTNAATYVVDNLTNPDPGGVYVLGNGTNTLRKCIRLANASPGLDVINFNVAAGPFIILSASSLSINDPVLIDGYTQPGASAGNLLIQLVGVTNGIQILQLNAGSDGSTIRGLVIYTNNTSNIAIQAANSNNHVISGNYIGTDITGTVRGGTTSLQNGINLNPSTGTTIGGIGGTISRNIISACSNIAVRIQSGSNGTTIQGNYIGTTITGNAILANSNNGIDVNSANNITIGGSVYAARNIISGNQIGINIQTCTTLVVKGNFVGIGANGSTAIANTSQGIRLQTNCSSSTIGGSLACERNIVSANTNDGMQFNAVAGLTIQNNYVGLDSTGLVAKGNGNNGINIQGSCSTILVGGSAYNLRNIIGNNSGVGLRINTVTVSTTIKGNFIGLALNGSTAAPNTSGGIQINTAVGVVIGGALLQERNVVSSNTGSDGIQVSAATGVTVQNNYIGFDSTGLLPRGNASNGINIQGNCSTILVGGSAYNLRNVIGNSASVGLRINTVTVSTTIKGNFIGLAANGTTAAGNGNCGILINTAVAVVIGGPLVQERNIVSSNVTDGIQVNTATGLTVQNNYVGLDSTGLLARGNSNSAVSLNSSSTVLVGGSAYNLRNVLCNSTNGSGLKINNCTVSATVKGNFIGLNVNGTTAAGNSQNGMDLNNNTGPVTIGGPLVVERNIVSSNAQRGMNISNCTPVVIQNNYIGTDSTGMLNRGNVQQGINASTVASLTIGGSSYNLRNLVCSSGQMGVVIGTCPGTIFKGNFIGVAKDGKTNLGNGQDGLLMQSNSNNSFIGGTALPERNIFSCNLQRGIELNNSTGVTIVNNYVGVDSTGTLAKGNGNEGMSISNSNTLIIGGTTVSARNIVSNNTFTGIKLNTCTPATVQGNYVGVDVTGMLPMGNLQNGLDVSSCVILIGGTTFSARNIISGNGQDGIYLHNGCAGSVIKANFTGLAKDGLTVIANVNSGIRIWGDATSNGITIGGSNYAERNVSSGNGFTSAGLSRDGIRIEGNASNHTIKGNYCGTDSTGTVGIGNKWAGISLNEVSNGIIGGTGTYEGNISAANTHEGIYMRNAVNCVLVGNFVGTDKTGTLNMGNGEFGVNMVQACTNNTLGGNTPAQANIIAYTGMDATTYSGSGVFVDSIAQYNRIVRNQIFCNADLGIHVKTTGNEAIPAPSVTAADPNTVSGIGSIDGDSIHVYHTNVSGGACDCEGKTFIGATVVSGGTWTITHGLNYSIPTAYDVTATETTANKSTSQFSICNTTLPVEFVSFTVKKFSDRNIAIQWSTAWEVNNSYFLVDRKNERGEFEALSRVPGRGSYQGVSNYTAEDQNPLIGINYYRITQVDVDGRSSSTAIRAIQVDGDGLQILLTTEGVGIISPESTKATLSIYSELGQELVQKQIQLNANTYYPISIGLQNGVYLFYVATLENSVWKKVPVRQ